MSGGFSASNITSLSALMFATGMGIPLMASLNAGLGQQLQSAAGASLVLFGVGFVLAAALLLAVGLPAGSGFAAAPWYLYTAAAPMLFYIVSITFSAPRIGLGNAIFFVLVGQLVAAATIDHFGLFGALRTAITLRRAIGILVMAGGVYLARKPR